MKWKCCTSFWKNYTIGAVWKLAQMKFMCRRRGESQKNKKIMINGWLSFAGRPLVWIILNGYVGVLCMRNKVDDCIINMSPLINQYYKTSRKTYFFMFFFALQILINKNQNILLMSSVKNDITSLYLIIF